MLKALAAPMVLDEKKSADGRCGGDGKLGGALFDMNKQVRRESERRSTTCRRWTGDMG